WIVRRYDAARRRHLEERIATADDFRDADGVEVLDFGQVQRKALAEAHQQALHAGGKLYTVADAVADYLDYLRAHPQTAAAPAIKLKAYGLPRLGTKRGADLTAADFEAWMAWALKRRKPSRKPQGDAAGEGGGPEARAGDKGGAQADSGERQRRRKATLN